VRENSMKDNVFVRSQLTDMLRTAARCFPRGPLLPALVVALSCVLTLGAGCAGSRPLRTVEKEARAPEDPQRARERAERMLRDIVDVRIQYADEHQGELAREIRFARPYYYKEYDQYLTKSGEYRVNLSELDSTFTPIEAMVILRKARFKTRYNTSRAACAEDERFVRDIGEERLKYVYSNGRWTLKHTYFETFETAVETDGKWVDADQDIERFADEESPSVLRRVLGFFGI